MVGLPMFHLLNHIERFVPEDQLCAVSDQVAKEGKRINLAYRVKPEFEDDSGWRFLAGWGEEEADASNWDVYPLNLVCNYESRVIEILDRPIGTDLQRGFKSGRFVEEQVDDVAGENEHHYTPNLSFDSDIEIEFIVLPEDQFETVSEMAQKKVRPQGEAAEQAFHDRISEAQDAIVTELRKHWTEEDDFYVHWDVYWYCYYTYSSIYSRRILCEGLIRSIVRAHSAIKEGEKWSHGITCEIEDGSDSIEAEILVQHNKVFLLDIPNVDLRSLIEPDT